MGLVLFQVLVQCERFCIIYSNPLFPVRSCPGPTPGTGLVQCERAIISIWLITTQRVLRGTSLNTVKVRLHRAKTKRERENVLWCLLLIRWPLIAFLWSLSLSLPHLLGVIYPYSSECWGDTWKKVYYRSTINRSPGFHLPVLFLFSQTGIFLLV